MKTLIRLAAIVAAVVIQSLSSFASDIGGITNIHVNAFVPYKSFPGISVGNVSMWFAMSEDGLARKLYLEHRHRGLDAVTNSIPDGLFPSNTVVAHVWRGQGAALTNVYNQLTENVANTIVDSEAVNLLTNFGPLVKSVSRGVGSATIPYVDAEGNQLFGRAIVLGCEPGDYTAYEIIVDELKRLGPGEEKIDPESGVRKFSLTNTEVRILGDYLPSVVCGPKYGRVVIYTAEGVFAAISRASAETVTTGKKPFYDARHAFAVAADAELRRIDPTYTRNYKTEGFERFAYAYVSPAYQTGLAKMLEGLGLNPGLALTNAPLGYLATLCSETCGEENMRMRIDVHGTHGALQLIGATHRVSNLFLVNAGILDEDFMTFDEDWKPDPEILAKVKGFSTMLREEMGLKGVVTWHKELEDRVAVDAVVGAVPGKKFEQFFFAGKAGKGDDNPCGRCLPTNTVAGFVFQPDVASWVELNQNLLSFLGVKDESLWKVMDAFKSHPDSFGKSASLGLVLGASNQTIGSLKVGNGMDFISTIKIENENLWASIRILLEQLGCEMQVSGAYPSVTYCELPRSGFHIAYDRDYGILQFATSGKASMSIQTALRDSSERLINLKNETFCKRMGFDGSSPEHNVLYYFAPGTDTAFLESLGDYLNAVGLGALTTLIKTEDRSDLWLCGYGVKDGNGLLVTKNNISKAFWDRSHTLFQASAKTFGQIMSAAFPYDASKARVYVAGDMTFHVSRADNWDDVNGRLFDYAGDNLRVRVQTTDSEGKVFDRVLSCRLEADGYFETSATNLTCRGYLSSEGVFGEFLNLAPGYFIGREEPEIEAELSVLPSAEEIADQLKEVVDAIGVESVFVGAAKSDDRKGPFGEPTVVRDSTITPDPNGMLAKLLAQKGTGTREPMAYYMPSNTAFGASFTFSEGALSNAVVALKYFQPELIKYVEELLLGFGVEESELVASVNDGLALGIAKYEDTVEPYFAVRLKRGQRQNWVALTNRLYTTAGVKVMDFQASTAPGIWEAIAFTRVDPISGREVKRSYSRIFEGDNREPAFIITQGTELRSGIMAAVRRAGLVKEGRLVDDETFKACYTEDSSLRGFIYLAPIQEKYWFYKRLTVTEDGELAITRRTSAAVAPYESMVARFAVNFFEALRGEQSKITFENDPEADKVAEAAAKRITDAIHRMRTKLGVTGLDFYDADPDEDGRYGNSELAIGTKGDGCEFMKRFAADTPASEHLVEQYIPATACVLATKNAEVHYLTDDIGYGAKAVAELVGEKYPYVAAAITNYLASDSWKIITESLRLTGSHRAFAILQDFEKPFVKSIGGDNYAGISAGYAAVEVFGPMESALPFLLVKQAVADKPEWKSFTTNGVEYLIRDGQMFGYDIKSYVRPTFAFDPEKKVLVLATLPRAAGLAIRAGRDGENRLIDSETFADVMGFDLEAEMPEHNTLYYLAPQNDDILGCTLRRVLGPYLPDGYAMLFDRPSLKSYWGGAYGTRVNDAFRLYIHAGMKGHTAFLAAAQALLKTAAESMRVRQPYDWTESKVFRSADGILFIEPTDDEDLYAVSYCSVDGGFALSYSMMANSDNYLKIGDYEGAAIMSKRCLFISTKSSMYDSGQDTFRLSILDEEADPSAYTRGIVMEFDADEQTFAAGEKVEQKLFVWPTDAKVTKVTGLPKGLSLKKTSDGYYLVGTPTKVGEDCTVWLTATCAGRQTSTIDYYFTISNYASDYAELDAGYDLTAGIDDTLMLTNVAGWTAAGVPSGMKFDKATGALSGTPTKPGEYVVTFTKKIDGATEKVSTVITVGQEDGIQIATGFSDKTSGLAKDGETRVIYAGVKIDWPIEVKGLEDVETTLSAKGLPNGLKLVKVTDKLTGEVSYSIQGIATKASAVDKKTDEVMPSTVVLTGTNKYKWTGVETFDLVVKALPDWAIGTFNGYNGNIQSDVYGSIKVTVSKLGKVSVSLNGVSPSTGKTAVDAFTLTGFDSYDTVNKCFAFSLENVKMKSGAEVCYSGSIELDPNFQGTQYEEGRYFAYWERIVENEDRLGIQWGGNFDWTAYVFPTGKNQLTLALTDEVNPGLEGITLKFANGGKVTVAGTVVDPEDGKNVRVSASAALVYKSYVDIPGDGYFPASVGFVVKTKTPFYAYVPVWLKRIGESDTFTEVYETGPTKDE